MPEQFAIKVIWSDGEEEFLKEGLSATKVAKFSSRKQAQSQADFMKIGMDGDDDVQSVNVVTYPRRT